MQHSKWFKVESIPNKELDAGNLFECVGSNQFAILFDLGTKETFMMLTGAPDSAARRIRILVPGLKLSEKPNSLDSPERLRLAAVYRKPGMENPRPLPLGEIMDICDAGKFCIIFCPSPESEIGRSKREINRILGGSETKNSTSVSSGFWARSTNTKQMDVFKGSEERLMLVSILESLDNALLTNGLAYRVHLAFSDSAEINEYVQNRFAVLWSEGRQCGLGAAATSAWHHFHFSTGTEYCRHFISFSGWTPVNYNIRTLQPRRSDGIPIGNYLKDGVAETGLTIRVEGSTLNMGILLTGLPGSGKTMEAMSIMDSVMKAGGERG